MQQYGQCLVAQIISKSVVAVSITPIDTSWPKPGCPRIGKKIWWPDILPKDTLPKDILPKDILPTDVLPNGRFAERTFCRMDILPNTQFTERTVCRK